MDRLRRCPPPDPIEGLTWLDIARRVAVFVGVTATNDQLDYLLWEYTGFPGFWRSDNPVNECGAQLAAALLGGEGQLRLVPPQPSRAVVDIDTGDLI